MPKFYDFWGGVRGSARVLARRPWHGAARPSWSWSYEIAMASIRAVAPTTASLEERRKQLDAFGEQYTSWEHIDVEPVSGKVRGEWVLPKSGYGENALLYLHGGGYCVGSPASHRNLVGRMASACHATAFSVDYRLAPEHPCPAAIEDALAAYDFLLHKGVAPSNIIVAGDSAGGGLALALVQALAATDVPMPAGCILLSPWCDLRPGAPLLDTGLDYLTDAMLAEYSAAYLSEIVAGDDPRASPISGELDKVPPLLVVAGGQELLVKQSRALTERAGAAGVDVHYVEAPDEIHVYPFFFPISATARAAFDDMRSFVERIAPETVSEASVD